MNGSGKVICDALVSAKIYINDFVKKYGENNNRWLPPSGYEHTMESIDIAIGLTNEESSELAEQPAIMIDQNILDACEYALERAANEIDGSRIENLELGITESTGSSTSCLIALRDLRQARSTLIQPDKLLPGKKLGSRAP